MIRRVVGLIVVCVVALSPWAGELRAASATGPTGTITLKGSLLNGTHRGAGPGFLCGVAPGSAGTKFTVGIHFQWFRTPKVIDSAFLSIAEFGNAAASSVNLATTKQFYVTLAGPTPATTWQGGWQSNHFGTGMLSMSPNGRSGTLKTVLAAASGVSDTLSVSASWHC